MNIFTSNRGKSRPSFISNFVFKYHLNILFHAIKQKYLFLNLYAVIYIFLFIYNTSNIFIYAWLPTFRVIFCNFISCEYLTATSIRSKNIWIEKMASSFPRKMRNHKTHNVALVFNMILSFIYTRDIFVSRITLE